VFTPPGKDINKIDQVPEKKKMSIFNITFFAQTLFLVWLQFELKGFQEQTKKKKVGIFFMTKQVKI
jgi:hypothetical protein